MPYSETCRPLRTAASRMAMLCCLEPVKCWSRFPNWSGATIFRSTGRPVWVRPRVPASVARPVDSMISSSLSAEASATGSCAVAITSRSLTESASRRAEPASSTCSEAGWARSAATIASAAASALGSSMRSPGTSPASNAASEARMFSSALAPNPRTPRIAWFAAASRSASIESMPSSS